MKKELILIDASWVIHIMWHVHQDLQVALGDGTVLKSGHIYGVARLLKNLNLHHPESDIIFCLDGVAEHGKSINPEYKANRGSGGSRTAFDDLGIIVECAVAFKNTKVAFHRALEADEIISYFAKINKTAYENIVIYSADGDMLQLLNANTHVAKEFNSDGTLKLVRERDYYENPQYVDKFLGCKLELLPLYRAIVGDSSDNLPGFPRIRKKIAVEIVSKYESLDGIAEGCFSGDSMFPTNFASFIETMRTNYEIMRLPTFSDLVTRGQLPKLYEFDGDGRTATNLFSLYRIKSVSPVATMTIDPGDEVRFLAFASVVNLNWKHPKSH